ncbi:MAG TPA: hypothetical protein VNN18_05625 [Candidatus Xenobia bacterium]|nr:hypothetical protein [Candidatus Xenobia bacterium]
MNDDYLWDKTGAPDPKVEGLEKLLACYRHQPRRIDWTKVSMPAPARWHWLSAAAVLVVVVGVGMWVVTRPSASSWEVARLEGSPRLGAASLETTAKLRADEWLQTGPDGRARLESAIGAVEVEANTRLRLRRARLTEHRLEMAQGTIHATIWAPPRLFFVETPSAVAVDLGCQYTLHVDAAGAGRVDVTSGWVAFEYQGRESFIPAGGACHTRPGVGPGTPFFGDSSEKFRAALEQLDFGPLEARATALQTALSEARPRDAFSLWHLLARGNPEERALVYDRLAQLVPPPAGVTRDGILRGNRPMLDLWWDALGYGDTSWFRLWKRDLPR